MSLTLFFGMRALTAFESVSYGGLDLVETAAHQVGSSMKSRLNDDSSLSKKGTDPAGKVLKFPGTRDHQGDSPKEMNPLGTLIKGQASQLFGAIKKNFSPSALRHHSEVLLGSKEIDSLKESFQRVDWNLLNRISLKEADLDLIMQMYEKNHPELEQELRISAHMILDCLLSSYKKGAIPMVKYRSLLFPDNPLDLKTLEVCLMMVSIIDPEELENITMQLLNSSYRMPVSSEYADDFREVVSNYN